MFNRERLLSIGGFDPTWYHAEDMEVSLKLVQEGGTIVYTPDAVVGVGARMEVFTRTDMHDAYIRIRPCT